MADSFLFYDLETFGQDPRRINALAKRMLDSVSLDGGHIHRTVIAAIEVACWDILGKSLGVPVHQLLGGQMRESVLGYANGWYRTERTPEAFLEAAKGVLDKGFKAFKLDPFGTAQGFISREELELSYAICRTLRAMPAARSRSTPKPWGSISAATGYAWSSCRPAMDPRTWCRSRRTPAARPICGDSSPTRTCSRFFTSRASTLPCSTRLSG